MAANYFVADPLLGAPMPATLTGTFQTATSAAQAWPPVPLGMEVRGFDRNTGSANVGAGVFIMCRGSNVASAGQFVHIINNSAVLLASGNSASFYPIGVAAGVISATNVWGWVQVEGIADYCRCSNSDVAAGGRIAFGSTAGQVGTVTALGSRIHGIIAPVSATADNSNSLTFQLHRPFAIGITGSN